MPRSNCVSLLYLAIATAIVTPELCRAELYVTNFYGHSITVHDRTATGNTAPLRTISGGSTGLSNPIGIAVDEINAEVFVANYGNASVTVYDTAASGDAAPLRTLAGAATGFLIPEGLTLDPVNDELIVSNYIDSMRVFPRTASGNSAPVRALTTNQYPVGVAVDTVNDEVIIAINSVGVQAFNRTASGNALPLRTISGSATGFAQPRGLAVDLLHDEIIVANQSNSSVRLFSRTATGDVAPLRALAGASTGLSTPVGVAIDPTNDVLFVTNSNSITVYHRTDDGDVAPLRTISGGTTQLNGPYGIAVVADPTTTTTTSTTTTTTTTTETTSTTTTTTTTTTTSTTTTVPGVGHLKCYSVTESRPEASYTLDLASGVLGFPTESGCTLKLHARSICVEVEKQGVIPPPPGGGPMIPPNAGSVFLSYKVKCPKQPVSSPIFGDQFGAGSFTVGFGASSLGQVRQLLVPAVPGPANDHFKCYKAKDTRPKATYTMDLLAGVPGFVDESGCTVKLGAKEICIQASKQNVTPVPPGAGPGAGPDAGGTFILYKLKCPKAVLPPGNFADQFGPGTFIPGKAKRLLVPAE